ncbi:MAG: transporter substrate-binding protein [Nitrospiraceae bacterium]
MFYPVQYEGEECSRNVFYTGAAVNQQAVPAVEYLMSKEGGGHKSSTCSNGLRTRGPRTRFSAPCCSPSGADGEHHGGAHAAPSPGLLQRSSARSWPAAGGGACVISTINGDSNVPFYKEFANQGLRAEDAPIMAFSVAEDELRGMDTTALVGHLAAWNY